MLGEIQESSSGETGIPSSFIRAPNSKMMKQDAASKENIGAKDMAMPMSCQVSKVENVDLLYLVNFIILSYSKALYFIVSYT